MSDNYKQWYDDAMSASNAAGYSGMTAAQTIEFMDTEWKAQHARITELQAQLETERMRLAACGVVAMSNTPESATRAREMHPDYMSASCGDVARMVDEQMDLRAQLEAAQKANQWQPIETAPKDGTSMLVYHNRMTLEAWYSLPWNKFVVAESGGTNNITPTHWMPLPAAPAIQAEGKQE